MAIEMIWFKNGNQFARVMEGEALYFELKADSRWTELGEAPNPHPADNALPPLSQSAVVTKTSSRLEDLERNLEIIAPIYGGNEESQGDAPQQSQPASAGLAGLTLDKLKPIAQELGINPNGIRKDDLIDEIERRQQQLNEQEQERYPDDDYQQ